MRVRADASAGFLVLIYLVAVPFLVVRLWPTSATAHPAVVRTLLAALVLLWTAATFRLVAAIVYRRRGVAVSGGFAWLAGVVLSIVTFTPPALAATHATPDVGVHRTHARQGATANWSLTGAVPLALMAKRRRDELQQLRLYLHEDELDAAVDELRGLDDELLARLRDHVPAERDGVFTFSPSAPAIHVTRGDDEPVVVFPVDEHQGEWTMAYARPGGTLRCTPDALALLANYAVSLQRDGRVEVTDDEHATLRALALRPSSRVMVLYTGSRPLESDVAALCVQLHAATPTAPPADLPAPPSVTNANVRVHFLSADVHVRGLAAPFQTELQRRCLEMTAYLALHRHEPVSGDRLRSRVLGGDRSDASLRTLSNTASAVRRALGVVDGSPRLLPVGPGGHYRTHDLDSDVEALHALIARAKSAGDAEQRALLRSALELVRGEPLAVELRGFEWFLAEGHLARLQRDGEWAALRLSQLMIADGDYDRAFWALEQGRLLDSYSDDLVAALARVPRLREFGADRGR